MTSSFKVLVLQINNPCFPDVNSSRRGVSRGSARSNNKSRCPSRLIQTTSGRRDRKEQSYLLHWRENAIGMDYDGNAKKKSYWQHFANEKVKELLKDSIDCIPKREPVYTARCGPTPKFVRSSSVESIATDISLLSVSTVRDEEPQVTKPKRKRKGRTKANDDQQEKRPDTKQGPGWESFAKQKKGILDAMIRKDTGNLEGFVKGKVIDRARAMDIMSEEERMMIMNCGYTSGIACKEKSSSTENLISFYTRDLPESEQKPVSRNDLETYTTKSVQTPYKTGRTPSPRFVIKHQKPEIRPGSAMPYVNLPSSRPSSASSGENSHRRFSKGSVLTGPKPAGCQTSRRGSVFPSIDGRKLGKKTNRKIQSTIRALHRMTGYGDSTSVMASQED